MSKTTKAVTVPVTPNTGNPASVFSWLEKHFGATKHAYQVDSNPYSSRVHKTGDITAAGRKALTAHCLANPGTWEMCEDGVSFHWPAGGVRLNLVKHTDKAYTKHFSFSAPKKAKPFTVPY